MVVRFTPFVDLSHFLLFFLSRLQLQLSILVFCRGRRIFLRESILVLRCLVLADQILTLFPLMTLTFVISFLHFFSPLTIVFANSLLRQHSLSCSTHFWTSDFGEMRLYCSSPSSTGALFLCLGSWERSSSVSIPMLDRILLY